MGIYKRGKIYWIDFYDQNRKRIPESSQTPHRRDAESLYTLRKSEALRGLYKQPVKISLGEFGERYVEHAKANKRSWLRDEQMLNHLCEFFGKDKPLTEVTPVQIESYKIQRQGKIADSTVNRELALLKRMFNLAITWDLYFGLNPVRKVKFFREINNRLRVLSPEEEKKLLQNAIPYLEDLIRFASNTGLRTGEIFSLRWSHVDLQRGILAVFASKTQTIREIPINSETRKVLEAWKLNRKNGNVFYNPQTGKPFVDLKTGFALACEKAGISDVTWHTLRHTFASRLVISDIDIVTEGSTVTKPGHKLQCFKELKRRGRKAVDSGGLEIPSHIPDPKQLNTLAYSRLRPFSLIWAVLAPKCAIKCATLGILCNVLNAPIDA